jgi:hypothetical protein
MLTALIATLSALLVVPGGPRDFWTVDVEGMPNAERALLQSVQGIANRQGPLVWQRVGGMAEKMTDEMKAEGWTEQRTKDVWQVVAAFRPQLKGAVLCDVRDESLNRAATDSGLKDLLVVDASLEAKAKAEGFSVVEDARTEARVLPGADPELSKLIAVEQPPDKAGFLRDYAIKHRALCFLASDSRERRHVLGRLSPGAWVLGWGSDEYRWVSDISWVGGIGCAADWCANLSAMESLGGAIRSPRAPEQEPDPKPGERVVAFVLTDGDNVQWLTGGMPLHEHFYGSPLRGTFKMTWEVSPMLARFAPRVLDYMYGAAGPKDGFVAAGAPGYSYMDLAPDRKVAAKQTGPLLRASGLHVVGVINSQEGELAEAEEILDLPEVEGVVYKDYAPYHGKHGAVWWHKGKPCVGYRFSLWDQMAGASPDEVAAAIAKLPADPTHDTSSYALVTVHAWSYGSIDGPLEAVRQTITKLPPGTRVVTAPELVGWMKRFCAPRAP